MDHILAAADSAFYDRRNSEKPREYLGMSTIGDECERKLWYNFRWVAPSTFPVQTLKKFDDGHKSEDTVIARLIEGGVDLSDKNEQGDQYALSLHNGLFRGHLDGLVSLDTGAGLTMFVFEAKCCDPSIFATFQSLKSKHGEATLEHWNETYYGQAQMYSNLMGIDCWHVVSTAGARDWDWVITRRNPDAYHHYVDKAERIITTDRAYKLPRCSSSPTWWKCKICNYIEVCHYGASYQRNCRTCEHVKVNLEDGDFECHYRDDNPFKLTYEQQLEGCQAWTHINELKQSY